MKSIEELEKTFIALPEKVTYKAVQKAYELTTDELDAIIKDKKILPIDKTKGGEDVFDKNLITEGIYNVELKDTRTEKYNQYYKYLQELFTKAIQDNGIETLYTVLEVGGMFFGHWNPTEEVRRFFDDFNVLLKQSTKSKSRPLRKYRLGLLMYCHSVEMNFGHQILANILRTANKLPYVIDPFTHLRRTKKNKFGSIPPSAKSQFEEIKKLADKFSEPLLKQYIDEFFNDDIRNAFSHSDYCLTDKGIRYKQNGGFNTEMPYKELDTLIINCFAFFEALFHVHVWAKAMYANMKKYHKLQGYEVLEILSKNKQAYGFNMHFSNGSKSTFIREPESVLPLNIVFEEDGTINFQVGLLSDLTNEWKVDGKPFTE